VIFKLAKERLGNIYFAAFSTTEFPTVTQSLTEIDDEPGFSEQLLPLRRRQVAMIHYVFVPADIVTDSPTIADLRGQKGFTMR